LSVEVIELHVNGTALQFVVSHYVYSDGMLYTSILSDKEQGGWGDYEIAHHLKYIILCIVSCFMCMTSSIFERGREEEYVPCMREVVDTTQNSESQSNLREIERDRYI
jgi:hypothetical protein